MAKPTAAPVDDEEESTATLGLLARFLKAVSDREYFEAGALSESILKIEPDNKIILEYQPLLRQACEVLVADDDEESSSGEEGESGGEENGVEEGMAELELGGDEGEETKGDHK